MRKRSATSSYTLAIVFCPLRYMLRISRNALYTRSSAAKRVLILLTYAIAGSNSTAGFGAGGAPAGASSGISIS